MVLDSPRPDEWPFIFDSWTRSFRKSPWAGCIPNHLYDAVSRAVSAGIVDRGARVLVALPSEETRRIMGYSVSEPASRVLHWLYVKDDFRRMGIGTRLLRETCGDGEGWTYTFRTRMSQRFLGKAFAHDPVPARVK